MRNTFKKGLSVLLALVLLFGSVAIGGEEIGETISSFSMRAEALESTGNATFDAFINDSRFTHGISWGTIRPKLSSYDCWECCAYCADFVKYCFGYNTPKAGEYFTGATNIRAGDVIVVGGENGNGHWFVCLKRSGNSLYVAEGNYASKVRIGWNYTIVNDSTISGTGFSFSHGWHYLSAHTCDYKASARITKAPTKTATGTRVRTCSCGKTYTQTIPAIPYTTDVAEGIYYIQSKNNSNVVLATNKDSGYNAFVANYVSSWSDQYWILIKNSDGTYSFESARYDDYYLDVYDNSMVNNGNVIVYPRKTENNSNEKFYLIPSGGYYKIVNKLSYNILDADNPTNGSIVAGANVQMYEDLDGSNQLWALKLSNPPLNLSSTSVTVSAGSSKTVNCTIGRETYGVTFNCNNSNTSVCSVSWGNWNGMTLPLTITGKAGGTATLTITMKDYDTGIAFNTKTITVTVPDTTKPTVSISATNNAAASQTATLSLSDDVGLAGYYWGTSSSYSSNTYASVSGTSKSVTKTVSDAGTYYLTAKDAAGNVSATVSKTFYKTTLNAGSGSVSPSSVITASGNSFALPTPTRTGYTFRNWNTNSGGTGTAYYSGSSYKPTGTSTLYAQWTANTYTVSFNANGGSGAPANQTKTYGQTLTLSSTKPTRTGYTFKNWNTKADGSGTSYAAGASYTTNAAVTLYAQWTANTYTVSFNANGGSGAPANQTKTHGQTLTLSSTKPTRTGYTFKNWNTKADGSGTSYAAGASYTTNAAVTLYAQWQKNEATLQSISVKTNPTKTTYTVGETLNTAGLTLTATYSDKSTQTITSGFTCSPTKLDVAGFRTVTVSYGGKTATFGVTVNNPALIQGKVKAVSVGDVSIYYKSSTTLKPTVTADEGVKYTVKYESSNPNTASVDANGRVYGAHRGAAIITCTVTDELGNEVKASCVVTVDYSVWQWIIIILLFGWLWY